MNLQRLYRVGRACGCEPTAIGQQWRYQQLIEPNRYCQQYDEKSANHGAKVVLSSELQVESDKLKV